MLLGIVGRPSGSHEDVALAWASEQVFLDGDAYFAALIAAIDLAQRQLTLETYIFQADEIGTAVEEALHRARRRGVQVRLLVDGVGSAGWVRVRARQAAAAGLEVRVYHPPPWLLLPERWSQRLGQLLHAFRWVNRRNHRKVLCVDGRIALVGSFNIDRVHARSLAGAGAWRDTGVRVEGDGVPSLERAFERSWRHSRRFTASGARPSLSLPQRAQHSHAHHLVRLNHGLRQRARWRRDLLARIGSARARVWITSAYFVPDRRLLYALALAVANGADVRVLVPRRSDHWFMPLVTRAYYHRLTRVGVQVLEYLPGMLHAKTMLVDDWACVGSTNLNHRSLFHDLEADVVLTGEAARARLELAFREDSLQAERIDQQHWRQRSRLRRWQSRFVLLLRHWM